MLRDTAEVQQMEAWFAAVFIWPGDACSVPGREPVHVCPTGLSGSLGAHRGYSARVLCVDDPMNEWPEALPSHEVQPAKVTMKKFIFRLFSQGQYYSRKPTQEAPPPPAKSEERKGGVRAPLPCQGKRSRAGETVQEVLRTQDPASRFREGREPFWGAATLNWWRWWNISPASILGDPGSESNVSLMPSNPRNNWQQQNAHYKSHSACVCSWRR